MWVVEHTYTGRGTARMQTFSDAAGREFALITLREGDIGPSYVNAAESFRERA